MKNIHKLWRCAVADVLYMLADSGAKKKTDEDMKRRLVSGKHKGVSALNRLLLSDDKTFRNIFYYRMRGFGRLCTFCKFFLPPVKAVEIYGEIDGGLFLSHNHMVVHPQKAGENLTVGAGAVIGKNNGKYPVIGNNVSIGANATVIGNINIGDNVTVCAGSVVTKSLESNAVYGGNPARLIEVKA